MKSENNTKDTNIGTNNLAKNIVIKSENDSLLYFRPYNRVIQDYKSVGTNVGSNKEIYQDIIKEIDANSSKIKEIYLALYLFNNQYLYNKLLDLAKKGIKIIVFTIPLSGYDRRKIAYAKKIYFDAIDKNNFKIKIYPHMYIWYGARYAGGGAGYSFHIKAGMITYKNDSNKVFLCSGNLAQGDPTHTESVIFIEGSGYNPYFNSFKKFFFDLDLRAIELEEYLNMQKDAVGRGSDVMNKAFDFSYIGGKKVIDLKHDGVKVCFFSAPFYKINGTGSNHYLRNFISNLILNAKDRIILCAQHIHDISPFDNYSESTLIKSLCYKKETQKDVEIKVLKQVASPGLADPRRAAFVEAHLYYAEISQRINKLIHDKFIIIDDFLFFSTSNFTTTNLAYGERKMEYITDAEDESEVERLIKTAKKFFRIQPDKLEKYTTKPRKLGKKPKIKIKKLDIFSEVNGFLLVKNKELSNHFYSYFMELWAHKFSREVEIPF